METGTFEEVVIRYLRRFLHVAEAGLLFVALCFVDQLWAATKRMWRGGWLGVMLVGACVPAFGQVTLSDTDAEVTVLVPGPSNFAVQNDGTVAGNLSASPSTVTSGGMSFQLHSNTGAGTVEHKSARYVASLGAGVFDVYVRARPQNAQIPGKVDVDLDTALGGEVATRSFTTQPFASDAQLVVTTNVAGTAAGTYANYEKVGTVTVVGGGNVYVRFWGLAGTGTAVAVAPVVFHKVDSIPKWFKYIGGDVDTANYFSGLTAADAVSAVVLPVESLFKLGPGTGGLYDPNQGSPFEEQAYEIDQRYEDLTQQGVVSRYVQLTFTDGRYSTATGRTDFGTPTFGWIISLGRNGGLTARSVRNKADDFARKVQVSDWIQTEVGTSMYSGRWAHDQQWRDVSRFPKLTSGGYQEGGPGFIHTGKFLSRFPYSDAEWYGLPVMRTTEVNGTGTWGNTAPTSVLAPIGEQITVGGSYGSDGTTASLFTAVTVPAGYTRNDSILLRPVALRLRYPLHLNHIKCVIAACNASPPETLDCQKFVYLLSKFDAMCEEEYSIQEYRSEVAKGASDTVTIEDDGLEGEPDDAPDEAAIRPIMPLPSSIGTPPNRNTFYTPFPDTTENATAVLDLNAAGDLIGLAHRDELVIPIHSDPMEMAEEYGDTYVGDGIADLFEYLETWRVWFRAALLWGSAILTFWWQICYVWSRL